MFIVKHVVTTLRKVIYMILTDTDGKEGWLDQKGPASGLRILAKFTMLSTAISNTALTGETIWRPTDARASRRHRITKVSLSQRLVARNQAY